MSDELHILLIEGDQDDARTIGSVMAELHYTITTVRTLGEAHKQLEGENHIGLIITDLQLPDSTDLDTVRSIQEHFADIPLITISDHTDDGVIREIIRLGAQDYLPKVELDPVHLNRVIIHTLERHHLRQSLRILSFTDEMTGLYNRRGFCTLLEQQIALAERSGRGFYLFIIDLDYLKMINDTYGHLAGDKAIIDVADCLLISMRHHDIVGRLGGDEFGIVAINSTRNGEAHIRESIAKHFADLNATTSDPYQLSFSIGSIFYDGKEKQTVTELMDLADSALYEAKRAGHSRRTARE